MPFPPGKCLVVTGNIAGEKSELHKGTDANGEHSIEEIVNILPVVNRFALQLAIDEHVIMKEAMETKIAETTLVRAKLELFLPISAQSFVRSASANTAAPEVIKRDTFSLTVN
jgi:hypothetical protein